MSARLSPTPTKMMYILGLNTHEVNELTDAPNELLISTVSLFGCRV